MKRFLFLAIQAVSSVTLSAQVSINFNVNGPSTVEVRFTNIDYWVQYQFDSTQNFNSPALRTKISKGSWTDTVMGMKLGHEYTFRSRQIRSDGTVMSNWSTRTYYTANYPLSQYFNSGHFVNHVTYPIHKFIYNFYNPIEFWYDTTPNFNSQLLYKATRSYDYTPVYLPMYGKFDTLYVRAKVSDAYDSLPWKTVMLVKDFQPTLTVSGRSPCNDSSKFNVDFIYNFPSTFLNNNWKTYVKQGNNVDSSTSRNFVKGYELTDNGPFTVITYGQFSEDTFSGSIVDTSVLEDPLKLNQALQYVINTVPNTSILIYPGYCNTGIELELHGDTTYSNLLQSQYKNNRTSGSALQFNTNWSYFNGSALRYRIIRCGIKGRWFNIPNGNYLPRLAFASQPGVDTTNSSWTVFHTNYISGKQLEVQLDIHPDFKTPKKKTYRINDTASFKLESLFGNFNYARCRMVEDTFKSEWSNIVSKQFPNGSISKSFNNFTQPTWLCSVGISVFSGMEMRFGHQPVQMNYRFMNPQNAFPDIYDFAAGDTIFYQLRLFTPIDTSSWSAVLKDVYKGSLDKCFVPWISYNGYQNGLDTFYIRWKDKNPGNTGGFKIYIGPSRLNFKGEIDIPLPQSSYLIDRKVYPSNWYFALYPACGTFKTYTTLIPEWYPLNGLATSLDDLESSEIYYSMESGTIHNNSGQAYQMKLYDNLGRLLLDIKIEANSTYTLDGIGQGVYHLQLDTPYRQYRQSILIQ